MTAKLQQNPENTCSVMAMAGSHAQTLITDTNDESELGSAIASCKISKFNSQKEKLTK